MSDGGVIQDGEIVDVDEIVEGTALEVDPAVAAEPVAASAVYADLAETPLAHSAIPSDLAPVLDVPVDLIVEIGRTRMTIRETLAIGRGSVISLDRLAGEPADLLVNGRLIARGEIVAIDEEFGLRVTEVVSPEGRLAATLGS